MEVTASPAQTRATMRYYIYIKKRGEWKQVFCSCDLDYIREIAPKIAKHYIIKNDLGEGIERK